MAKKFETVRDDSTGLTFVRVPGGRIEVGLQGGELDELRTLLENDRELAHAKRTMAGHRTVTLAPFLVSRTPLPRELVAATVPSAETITGDDVQVSAKDAVRVLKRIGYRLLTEDEWEFVARGGSTNSWLADVHALIRKAFGRKPHGKKPTSINTLGVEGLAWGTWVAGAKGAGPPTVVRGGGLRTFPWQSDFEIASVHAAFRSEDRQGRWPLIVAWDGKPRTRTAPPPPSGVWRGNTHVATQLTFVDIPGGTFEMGLSPDERRRLDSLVPPKLAKAFAAVAERCPPRTVTVRPFRCATSPLSPAISEKLGGSPDMMFGAASNDAKFVAAAAWRFGFRLLSEAEWEYVARDGGTRGWGADLELLLRRAYRGAPCPEQHKNRFGVEQLASPVFVDTGKKLPELARSIAMSHFKYDPKEIIADSIQTAWTKSRGVRAALFAIAEDLGTG